MKTHIYLAFLFLFSLSIFAQNKENKDSVIIDRGDRQRVEALKLMMQNAQDAQRNTNQYIYSFDTRYEGLKGNYYFIPEWLQGDLYGVGGKIIQKNALLKYDAYNRELLMKKAENDTVAVYPLGFTLYDEKAQKSYTFMKYTLISQKSKIPLPDNYMLVMFKGKSLMMKNVGKRIVKADYRGAYNAGIYHDSFEDNSEYYLIKNTGEVEKFKLRKNTLIAAMGEHKDKIEEFIKSNNLTLKNDGDLTKVMLFYDGL